MGIPNRRGVMGELTELPWGVWLGSSLTVVGADFRAVDRSRGHLAAAVEAVVTMRRLTKEETRRWLQSVNGHSWPFLPTLSAEEQAMVEALPDPPGTEPPPETADPDATLRTASCPPGETATCPPLPSNPATATSPSAGPWRSAGERG